MTAVRDFYLERVENKIGTFAKKIVRFCEEKNIEPSVSSFLSHKSRPGQYVPDCYTMFIGGDFPKEFFCNSKKFQNFYFGLPSDFRDEITTPEEIKRYRRLLLINSNLEKLITKKLKRDYVYHR